MPWSQTTEYALRAVVCLADRPGASLQTIEIATVACVPPGYLAKVLQRLRRAGLVRARRGVSGGFSLARAPEAMTVLEVVNAVDPIHRIRECPLGPGGHGRQLCALHRRVDDALAALERALAETRVADVIPSERSPSLCPPPSVPLPLARRGRRKTRGADRVDAE